MVSVWPSIRIDNSVCLAKVDANCLMTADDGGVGLELLLLKLIFGV